MEGIGSEVSHKIRAAIKAKLIELGAYIDDELPDYIMVMVANKRSRHQMDEDLQLFLGLNTKTFTSWLHTVLQKLQEVTISNFEMKKAQAEKSGKRKNSNLGESNRKDRKSSEERSKTSKRHSKKHKEGKKIKKSKHKSKEKEKSKTSDKRQIRPETTERDKEKKNIEENAIDLHHDTSPNNNKDKTKEKEHEGIVMKKNSSHFESFENIDKFRRFRRERSRSSSKASSAGHFTDEPVNTKAGNGHDDGARTDQDETKIIEDEFNIEPLQPNEIGDQFKSEKLNDTAEEYRSELEVSSGMTIKAPTRELLKEHDKMHSENHEIVSKAKKTSHQESEESLPPEEIRKQLLLSRAKKKLEQSKIPGRMKSNSPEVEVIENNCTGKQEYSLSSRRRLTSKMTSRPREYDEYSKIKGNGSGVIRREDAEDRKNSPIRLRRDDSEGSHNGTDYRRDHKKNVISISKSLEMEKNLGVKYDDKKSMNKTNSISKKKPVPSRVVTIPEPEAPEISSIVKVKPREYIPKDKQANKALILKAVADAEKSIAIVHSRNDGDIEIKKSIEGIFTKNLRGKRYEKLAVTLSNVQPGFDDHDKTKRMVSVDSENVNVMDRKAESLKGSELSQGLRSIQELTLKNISNKSEDQFISSKTSAMEKNDNYIHCWLEGVEKAVKDDEIVNPSEIEDFHSHFSDQGKEEGDACMRDEERKKKKQKTDGDNVEDEKPKRSKSADKSNINLKSNKEEGPQIVVTLDGLTSKTIKDIILRNRDIPNGPLLSSKWSGKGKYLNNFEEVAGKSRYKDTDSSKNARTSHNSDSEGREKMSGFEKISERFGRINKTSESHEFKEKFYEFERERYEKKYLKYQGTDKEKHYEKLKEKYASAGESKNKMLIARLSEKFGKVDRDFEKKRKYPDDLRNSYSNRRAERDGKYRKLDRRSLRSGSQE